MANKVGSILIMAMLVASFPEAWAQDSGAAVNNNGSTVYGAGSGPAAGTAGAVVEGPLVAARQELLSRIHKAQSQGIGIGSYVNAFNNMEASIKQGQSEQQIGAQVESLGLALRNQLDKSKNLKNFHPSASGSAPVDSALAASGAIANTAASGGIKAEDIAKQLGSSNGDLVQNIKQRFGGQLPNIHSLPPELRDRLLNSDKGKDLLKQFGR